MLSNLTEKKILLTGLPDTTKKLKSLLEFNGACCLEFPLIRIIPTEKFSSIYQVLNSSHSGLVFTSRNGIYNFFKLFDSEKITEDILRDKFVFCVGQNTKKYFLEKFSFFDRNNIFSPTKVQSSKGLADLIFRKLMPKNRLAYYTGILTDYQFEQILANNGYIVDRYDLYSTIPPENIDLFCPVIEKFQPEWIIFHSPSAVEFLHNTTLSSNLQNLNNIKKFAVGEKTGGKIREKFGGEVTVSTAPTPDKIVEILLKY